MSFLTSFYNFITSSDYAAAADGASSAALVATSDMGSLLMALDSGHMYHITDIEGSLDVANKNLYFQLVTLDSDKAQQATVTPAYHLTQGASLTVSADKDRHFSTPIKVAYSSNAHFLSMRIVGSDSDAVASLGYGGFTSRV